MGLRQTMNEKPAVAVGVGIVSIGVAILILMLNQRGPDPIPAYKVFYTTDDGKTTFGGDLTMIPPFQHEGKEAVRVYMYEEPDGKPFPGFLEKFTPDARQRMLDAKTDDERSFALEAIGAKGVLVKKPGETEWVRRDDPRARAVMTVKDASGKDAAAVRPPD